MSFPKNDKTKREEKPKRKPMKNLAEWMSEDDRISINFTKYLNDTVSGSLVIS